jgi:hypothetical protein
MALLIMYHLYMFRVYNSENYEIIWLTSRPGPGVLGKEKMQKIVFFYTGISRAILTVQEKKSIIIK